MNDAKIKILGYTFFILLPMVLVLSMCIVAGNIFEATENIWLVIAWMYAYFCACLYGAFRFGSEHLLK